MAGGPPSPEVRGRATRRPSDGSTVAVGPPQRLLSCCRESHPTPAFPSIHPMVPGSQHLSTTALRSSPNISWGRPGRVFDPLYALVGVMLAVSLTVQFKLGERVDTVDDRITA